MKALPPVPPPQKPRIDEDIVKLVANVLSAHLDDLTALGRPRHQVDPEKCAGLFGDACLRREQAYFLNITFGWTRRRVARHLLVTGSTVQSWFHQVEEDRDWQKNGNHTGYDALLDRIDGHVRMIAAWRGFAVLPLLGLEELCE